MPIKSKLEPKSVLFVVSLYYPHIGGIEVIVDELAKYYRQQKIQVKVLTKKWPITLDEKEIINKTPIYRIISAKTDEEFYSVIDWIKKNEKELKADIIHVIGVRRPLPLIALLLARLWKVPLVVSVGGGEIPDPLDPNPGKIWEMGKDTVPPVLLQADWNTTFSKDLIKLMQSVLPQIEEISLIYAGLDYGLINSIKKVRQERPSIVSLRRLDPSKGVDILIKAFALIKDKHPQVDLVIIGDGEEEVNLKKLASDLHLESRVKFMGKLDLKTSLGWLKGALFTVVPSLSEGGGCVNIQAQAVGCPVIASNVGGIPEYVKDGTTGLLFPPGDFNKLAILMDNLISNDKDRQTFSENGVNFAKGFDWNKIAPIYLEGYKNLINMYDINKPFIAWSGLTKSLWERINKI